MKMLLLKDFRLNKKNMAIFIPMAIAVMIMQATMSDMPVQLYLVFASVMPAFLPISAIAQEDKFNANILYCSLPLDRSLIIQSKFIGSWIVAVAGFFLAILIALIVRFDDFMLGDAFSLATLTTVLFVITLIYGIFVPIILRFGFSGLIIVLIGFQVLGVVALLSASVLPGVLSIRQVIHFIIELIKAARASFSTGLFYSMILVLLLGFNFLSLKAAQGLFRTKDF